MSEDADKKNVRNMWPLPSGHTYYAYGGVVGIDHNANVYDGYDGCISVGETDKSDIPPEYVVEFCDAMIERWQKLRSKFVASPGNGE